MNLIKEMIQYDQKDRIGIARLQNSELLKDFGQNFYFSEYKPADSVDWSLLRDRLLECLLTSSDDLNAPLNSVGNLTEN